MTDLGKLIDRLSVEILIARTIILPTTDTLVERHRREKANAFDTPLDSHRPDACPTPDSERRDPHFLYSKLVGSLLYLATCHLYPSDCEVYLTRQKFPGQPWTCSLACRPACSFLPSRESYVGSHAFSGFLRPLKHFLGLIIMVLLNRLPCDCIADILWHSLILILAPPLPPSFNVWLCHHSSWCSNLLGNLKSNPPSPCLRSKLNVWPLAEELRRFSGSVLHVMTLAFPNHPLR
ncbi:hypothetical protein BJ742DRAFT_814348 [Cladochytrium replicatum]|nr:hypothetical protein BJ742DRAFT_814348 [Cladochytrium replicatum]